MCYTVFLEVEIKRFKIYYVITLMPKRKTKVFEIYQYYLHSYIGSI